MADVITLSDDDFSPAVETHARKFTSSSSNTKEKTVKQWNHIFSPKSIKQKNSDSKPRHLSHYSSTHSSKQSSKGSSKDPSCHSSERHSRHQSLSHEKERHRRKRSSSVKDVIELVSDEDTSPSGMVSSKKTSLEKSSSGRSLQGGSNHHSSKRSSHDDQPGKSSKYHHLGSSQHHSNKDVLGKSENSSGKGSSANNAPERPSSTKNSMELSGSEKIAAVTPNGRHSDSRRSLATEFGVSKAECRSDDDDRPPRPGCHVASGGLPKQRDAEPVGEDRSSRSKRPASGGREVNSVAKRVCLTRVESKAVSDSASTADPESEPKADPEPCHQSLEEVCTLLKPLLSGPELKLEAKVRRRHAAVLALTGVRAGRRQHLIGLTQQCAERLREEPERCFTVLRWFFEQLDQIKIVASSAQSHTARARAEATLGGYEVGKTGTPARATKEDARTTGAAGRKAMAADSSKASPSPSAAVGSAPPSTVSSEQDEKEARRHRRHVAKLEKTLRRLEREIVRQDEQEVDWGDGAGSSYMVGARLKRRYVQVYRYYCQLVGAEEQAQRLDSRRIRFDGTRYPEINRRIEKFVNRTREFPDFKDVLSLIKTANRRDRLQLGPSALHDQAKEAFLLLGGLLQKRRRAAVAESMDALAGAEEWRGRDPAAGDPVLSGQLAVNSASGQERLNKVFAEFVQRQETLAAERRQRHAGAAESSDEGEEDEMEETEESEVTDEELEQEMPRSVGRDPPDSDASDQDTVLSDEEIGGPGEGVVIGARDQNGHESAKAGDATTEEGANAGRKVEVTICSAAGNSTTGPSEGRARNGNAQPDIKDDRESSADGGGTRTSIVDVADTKRENDFRGRKDCEHAGESTEGEALGPNVSENNTLT